MMQRYTATLAVAAMAFLASGAAAQSINPALDRNQSETQVVGAVTVPLGQSTDRQLTAPRFEIISRSRTNGSDAIVERNEEPRWQERRIGPTLDGRETLMINGQPLASEDRGDGISTLGAVGIGFGVILALSIAVVADADDAIDDLIDPD